MAEGRAARRGERRSESRRQLVRRRHVGERRALDAGLGAQLVQDVLERCEAARIRDRHRELRGARDRPGDRPADRFQRGVDLRHRRGRLDPHPDLTARDPLARGRRLDLRVLVARIRVRVADLRERGAVLLAGQQPGAVPDGDRGAGRVAGGVRGGDRDRVRALCERDLAGEAVAGERGGHAGARRRSRARCRCRSHGRAASRAARRTRSRPRATRGPSRAARCRAGPAGGDAGGRRRDGDAGGAGAFARRQRARARRSARSFLRCFFTKARRAFAERCERKNARRRDAILRLNAFSRFVSAWHGFACAAAAMGSPAGRAPAVRGRRQRDEEGQCSGRERRLHDATLSGPLRTQQARAPQLARSQLVHHDHATLEWTAPEPCECAASALAGSDLLGSENCRPDCPEISAAGSSS